MYHFISVRKTKFILLLLCVSFIAYGQEEQAGIDLDASFPAITPGTIEHDLPANGNYWDPDDPGWGVTVEVQSRPGVAGGYFLFMTAFFYDDNNEPFWCAVSSPFDPQVDPNQWRDAEVFSNIPWGSTDPQVLVEMDVDCHSKTGGTALGSAVKKQNHTSMITPLHLVWRTPSRLEITPQGGITHYTQRLALHDDLFNPSMDWLMDAYWLITSSARTYGYGPGGNGYVAHDSDYNVKTGFERLDVSDQENLRAFIGHQEYYVYYISTLKASLRFTDYFSLPNVLQETPYAPYISFGGFSNKDWIVLVHDPLLNTVSLYTVAGDKGPELLRPNSGIETKFRADVNPDADSIDFYPSIPDCTHPDAGLIGCRDIYRTYSETSMANWSPRNVHRSTMKMFKIKTGGKGYLYHPNNGESPEAGTYRIKQQLIDDGTIPDDGG